MHRATYGFPSFDEFGKENPRVVELELSLNFLQPRQEFQDQPSTINPRSYGSSNVSEKPMCSFFTPMKGRRCSSRAKLSSASSQPDRILATEVNCELL